MSYNLSQSQFDTLKQQDKGLVLINKISNNNLLATTIFKKLQIKYQKCFLFESSEKSDDKGRYSVIGIDPDKIWQCHDNIALIKSATNNESAITSQDIINSLRNFINCAKIDYSNLHYQDYQLPAMIGGIFGYMGYDMIQYFEKSVNINHQIDEINIPDSIYIRPQIIIIVDNFKNNILICAPIYNDSQDISYVQLTKKIDHIIHIISSDIQENKTDITNIKSKLDNNFKSSHSQQKYCQIVKECQEYISKGDIFQILPSQRFTNKFPPWLNKFEYYLTLRKINPSPFLFYLQFDNFILCGSSPEIMVSLKNNKITVRPLAGTRKRGKNDIEDKKIEQELLSDEKELAEHLMLIDLGRHDVGRVSKKESVNVTKKMIIERYSHVMHISSNIEGVLKDDLDSLDALISAFPAGTVSGAPKIRAMEIIAQLENIKRSFYAGCVGYFSANNDMESCITLRSALIKDNKIHIQTGAGVVYDSVAKSEYQECINKAAALIKAYNDMAT